MNNKEAAIAIIKRLREAGFASLLAGGCVRDMLLGRAANDYDVATDAKPEDVMRLFKRTLSIGAKFGVVIVMTEAEQVEVATFRTETGYADGRHPQEVQFAGAAEDASRRDFTINGLFYDPLEEKVIDYVEGQADIRRKTLRTIGNADERFGEDYLRMLRAVRFSTQLGFEIEPATWVAVCGNAKNIARISGERIAMELEGILTDPNRRAGVSMLFESGLAEAIFGDFESEQGRTAVSVTGKQPAEVDFGLALAGFFAGFATEEAVFRAAVLKLSRNQIKHIKFLLDNRGRLLKEDMSLAELKMMLSEPYFEDLYDLQKAVQLARGESISPLEKLTARIEALGEVELRPKPLLDGYDLMELGVAEGPVVGHLARELYAAQLSGEVHNGEQARQWVRNWLLRHKNGTG
jgi:tRNA nucleotidyltransferase/poly(A) polymerase